MIQLWQKAIQSGRWLNEQTHGWLGLLASTAQKTIKPNSMVKAAAIAYFALFSLFPFILLSISIASIRLGSLTLMDQHLVIQRLEFVAPALGQLLGQNIDDIILERGPVTGLASLVLVWSASTVFYILTSSLNEIWAVERRPPVWRQRGLAIMLDVVLFMLLYLMLPHGEATWREILPGAIAAGFLWELAKSAFLFFISTYIVASNLVYGSVAAVIAFLTWAYLSGLIFIFGAYLSVAYWRLNLNDRPKSLQEAGASAE
jgi:membrane protein